jgi:hypothetical protein
VPRRRGRAARVHLSDYSAWFAAAYAAGVAAMIAHLLFALRGGVRLRRKSRLITEPALIVSLTRAAESIGAKFMPALAWCERVGAPTVVGVIRPAILIPLSLANGLSTEQVVCCHARASHLRGMTLVNLAHAWSRRFTSSTPGVDHLAPHPRRRELPATTWCWGRRQAAAYPDSLLRIAELTRGRAV